MEVCSRGILSKLCNWTFGTISAYKAAGINHQVRCYAARKGTREKARKKKVKVEIQKIGFIPHNLRKKDRQALSVPTIPSSGPSHPDVVRT